MRASTSIRGAATGEGDFVHVAIDAANRDPQRFAGPEVFEPDGDSSGHIAFGHGIHHCVGAPLARLEAEIAFTRLVERFPDLQLAEPEPDRVPGFRSAGSARCRSPRPEEREMRFRACAATD